MTRLTDTSVRALKPSARQYFVRDETLRGFGVRVSPGGTKTFALMHGAERRLTTIGRCGVITLQDARIAAKKMLAEETLGNHAPQTVTFCEALKLYISTHLPHNRTAYESERVLKKHLLSPLQSKKLTNIHYQHVAVIVDRIKTNSAANHLYVEARTFFNWAVKRHYLTVSPLAGSTPPHPFVSRDRVLTHEELRVLWRAAENIGYPYGTIVQLLFWGQRRGETAAIRSNWIANDLISFPPEFVKNGRRHDFPIGPLASRIIASIPHVGPMLFPARGHQDRPFAGWSVGFLELERLSGVREFVLHDIRRTFATELASLGVAIHVIEKLLNHSGGQLSGVAAIYNRFSYAKEMREAVLLWEKHLTGILAARQSRAA